MPLGYPFSARIETSIKNIFFQNPFLKTNTPDGIYIILSNKLTIFFEKSFLTRYKKEEKGVQKVLTSRGVLNLYILEHS